MKRIPTPKKTTKEALILGKDLLALSEIDYPESIAKATIQEVLDGLECAGYITQNGKKWEIDKKALSKLATILKL